MLPAVAHPPCYSALWAARSRAFCLLGPRSCDPCTKCPPDSRISAGCCFNILHIVPTGAVSRDLSDLRCCSAGVHHIHQQACHSCMNHHSCGGKGLQNDSVQTPKPSCRSFSHQVGLAIACILLSMYVAQHTLGIGHPHQCSDNLRVSLEQFIVYGDAAGN